MGASARGVDDEWAPPFIRAAPWARWGLPFGCQDLELSRSGMLGQSAMEGRGSRRQGSRLRENDGGVVMRAGGGDKTNKGSGELGGLNKWLGGWINAHECGIEGPVVNGE